MIVVANRLFDNRRQKKSEGATTNAIATRVDMSKKGDNANGGDNSKQRNVSHFGHDQLALKSPLRRRLQRCGVTSNDGARASNSRAISRIVRSGSDDNGPTSDDNKRRQQATATMSGVTLARDGPTGVRVDSSCRSPSARSSSPPPRLSPLSLPSSLRRRRFDVRSCADRERANAAAVDERLFVYARRRSTSVDAQKHWRAR